jgi:uncharacterized delta-60 repeat protein
MKIYQAIVFCIVFVLFWVTAGAQSAQKSVTKEILADINTVTSPFLPLTPGDLDPTFGHVGFKTTSITKGLDRAHGIVRQPDGKIVLAGNRNEDSGSAITLIRYHADGSLDTTFDGDGIILGETGQANAVALQPDGKIVITGRFGSFFAVLRFNTNGTPDNTFGSDGVFMISEPISGNAIAIQPDGKIVAAGTLTGGSDDFATIRLNSDGTLDTTFDGDGKVFTPVGDPSVNSGDDVVKAVAVQSNGKIIVGGFSPFIDTSRDFSLVRYNSDGSLDTTFDGDGILHTPLDSSSGFESLQSITLDGNGKIVAVGNADSTSIALIRYNQDGSLDDTFSGDGKLIIKTRPYSEQANAVVIQSGKILIAGFSGNFNQDFALVRFNSDGTLDQTFGSAGAVYTRVSEALKGNLQAVTLAPTGEIFAGGFAENTSGGSESFAFAKYSRDGVPSSEFGVFGYVTNNLNISPQIPSYEIKSIAMQPNGMFVAGVNYTLNTGNTNGILLRYDTNGSLDESFPYYIINSPSASSLELTSVALQPDGKILAVGNFDGNTNAGLFVSRFNSDGSRDLQFGNQFGNQGQVVISVFDGGGLGQDIAVLPDGKILVAGATANPSTQLVKFGIFKLNANGSIDTSFGLNGIATTSFSNSNDVALSIAVQADGKIVTTGASNFNVGSNSQIALARFNTNGTIDASFGTGGKVTTEVGGFTDIAADVQMQTDGKIVIGGVSCTDGNCVGGNALIFRYESNGSLDGSFDGDGKVFVQPTTVNAPTAISSISIRPDGKIVGGGEVISSESQSDVLIVRYDLNGSPDPTFGSNGIVSTDINGTNQTANSISLQPNGKILAAGSSMIGTRSDLLVLRYLGDQTQTLSSVKFDYDGDGRADLSVRRPSDDNWYVLRGTAGYMVMTFGVAGDLMVPADYDGDAKTDIAVFRPSTGQWFMFNSLSQTFTTVGWGVAGDLPVPADHDTDGKADLVVFRPSTNTWYTRFTNGTFSTTAFGVAGDKPLVGDFDGDGKSDIAVWRPSDGNWYILKTGFGFFVQTWGVAGDIPVPADYDGDGATDVAVFRPSTGQWFRIKSTAGFDTVNWGVNGDQPIPADYDGDGKSDVAVFRPSNATWYIVGSTSGQLIQNYGVAGDLPTQGAFIY